MQNVVTSVKDNVLTIEVDLSQTVDQTHKGNDVIAKTNGMFEKIPAAPGVILSISVLRWEKKPKLREK